MPISCRPDEMSVWDSLKKTINSAMSFSKDECVEYHEKITIDPLWNVNPTKVFLYMKYYLYFFLITVLRYSLNIHYLKS